MLHRRYVIASPSLEHSESSLCLDMLQCPEIVRQQFLHSDHTIDHNWRKTLGHTVETAPFAVRGNHGLLVDVEHVFDDQVDP